MKRIEIKLGHSERVELQAMVKKGSAKAREISRAQILLLSDAGKTPTELVDFLGVNITTIQNVKKRYMFGGLKRALYDAPRSGQPSRFSGKHRAQITALACSTPPEGHSQWSLRLLADKAVELGYVDSISHVEVGNTLKKMRSGRTSKGNGASRR